MASSKGLVLVTGANGFIAATTIEAFLKAGYAVRGTVRSLPSASPLLEALSEYTSQGLLEVVEVPDITVPGAFDSALSGVTAVAHLASPVSFGFTEVQVVLDAATKGTMSIVESAGKHSSVKSFVYMSSVAAVRDAEAPKPRLTEEDWSGAAEKIKTLESPPGQLIYAASKEAAEKAFWQWSKDHPGTFSATAVNPVFVVGPPVVKPKSPEEVSATNRPIWRVFAGEEYASGGEDPGFGWTAQTDVRDVARLVVFAVERPDVADQQRYISSMAQPHPQAAADILREAYPDARDRIKEGTPGQGYSPGDFKALPGVSQVVGDKAVRETGQDWIPYRQTVLDTAKAFEHLL